MRLFLVSLLLWKQTSAAAVHDSSVKHNLDRQFPSTNQLVAFSRSSALPDNYRKQLRDVKLGVEGLKRPPGAQDPSKSSSPSQCSFIGGLVSAPLSQRCCTNVQVISQRKLSEFGLAKECQADWQCEADGRTPKTAFEAQSLSELCGEIGCLPRVVKAMKQSWKTSMGATKMSHICSQLASLKGQTDATAISGLIREAYRHEANSPAPAPASASSPASSAEPAKGEDWTEEKCKEKICKVDAQYQNLCEIKKDKDDPCWEHCCEGAMCFPGEALISVEDSGSVPLANINVGDRVLVEKSGQLVYEPILTFLHVIRRGRSAETKYVTISHDHGMLRASSTHLVFVQSPNGSAAGWLSKAVGKLEVGDELMVSAGSADARLVASRVLAIRSSTGTSGMFAPLTSSGTIIVDGVVASNYAAPSQRKQLSHVLAHTILFPVRAYHHLGLAATLKPVWAWLCPPRAEGSKAWFCHGDAPARHSPQDVEEMHPFISILYRTARLDRLLPSESGHHKLRV